MKITHIGRLYQPVPNTGYGRTQHRMAQMIAFHAAIYAHGIILNARADSSIIQLATEVVDYLNLTTEIGDDANSNFIRNSDERMEHILPDKFKLLNYQP